MGFVAVTEEDPELTPVLSDSWSQALAPNLCRVSAFSSDLTRILPAVTAYVCKASSSNPRKVFCPYGTSSMDASYNPFYLDFFFILKSSYRSLAYAQKQQQRKQTDN